MMCTHNMFSWRNKKNIGTFPIHDSALSEGMATTNFHGEKKISTFFFFFFLVKQNNRNGSWFSWRNKLFQFITVPYLTVWPQHIFMEKQEKYLFFFFLVKQNNIEMVHGRCGFT